MESATEKMREILSEFSIHSFDMNDELQKDLKFDSLGIVDLLVAVEDSFGMRFDPVNHDLVSIFKTVGSLVAFLERYTNHG